MYFGFAVIGVGAIATINAWVPETKGKSLEEIEKMWEEKRDGVDGTHGE